MVAVPTLLTTAGGDRGADRASGDPPPRQPGGRAAFRAAVRLARCRDRARRRRCGAAGRGDRRHRPAQRRYGPAPGGDRFLLLHRRRVWNAGEARWIGWERKRGKLHELNRLLRGATDTTFLSLDGQPPAVPAGVRYVITLDADTRLPRDTVQRLIGKMAHPLNRPRFDAAAGRVVDGYAVLQPRVTPSLPVGREGSLFQRVFSSMNGIDPYAAAVSDVYQDLFGEGSYAGKGIYDVDAFEAALAGRVPDSTLAQPRSVRGHLRPRRPGLRHRGGRGFPARYDVAARAPASLGARRLAVAAVDDRPRTGRRRRSDRATPSRRSAAGRCSTICGARCRRRPACSPCWPAWRCRSPPRSVWTGFVLLTILLPPLLPVCPRDRAAPRRDHAAQPSAARSAPICAWR